MENMTLKMIFGKMMKASDHMLFLYLKKSTFCSMKPCSGNGKETRLRFETTGTATAASLRT